MIGNKNIQFHTLREFLLNLGFQERRGTSTFIFEHPETGTLLLFQLYAPNEQVDVKDLVVVRKMLDARGVMDRADFEDWFMETAA